MKQHLPFFKMCPYISIRRAHFLHPAWYRVNWKKKKKRDNNTYFSNVCGLLKLVFLIETVTFPLLIISHCLCSAPFLLSHKCWVIIPAVYSLVLPICLTYHALFIFSISDYMLTDFAIFIHFIHFYILAPLSVKTDGCIFIQICTCYGETHCFSTTCLWTCLHNDGNNEIVARYKPLLTD